MNSEGLDNQAAKADTREERIERILASALEVFLEFSFEDATTLEIARRAHVSKRDIYANYPDKQSLLLAVLNKVLKVEEDNILETIARTRELPTVREKLEAVGMTLITEILSVPMSILTRHVALESVGRPMLGIVYFENGSARRSELISELLSAHLLKSKNSGVDTVQASEHYQALIAHRPLLTTLVGMQDQWDVQTAKSHIKSAVDCFLRAYPYFA
jgi:AcrR family transcriptional regulator